MDILLWIYGFGLTALDSWVWPFGLGLMEPIDDITDLGLVFQNTTTIMMKLQKFVRTHDFGLMASDSWVWTHGFGPTASNSWVQIHGFGHLDLGSRNRLIN